MGEVLALDDLYVRYPARRKTAGWRSRRCEVEAVAGVTLSIAEGETFALVGESGSGKTSTAMAIIGLAPISAGRLVLGGTEVQDLSKGQASAVRKNTVMLFQDAVGSLSPRLTVRSLIVEALKLRNVPRREREAECNRLLALVGLRKDLLQRYPHQLSGGQARRIGIARALALNPNLILADEPTAGLDVSVQGEVINLLVRLQGELGLSILMISHNLNVVRLMAQRVGIMYLGRLVEEGAAASIFSEPRHPYTSALLAANLKPDPSIEWHRPQVKGEVPSLFDRPSGCEFHPRCFRSTEVCKVEFPVKTAEAPGHHVHCHWPLGSDPAPAPVPS